jgi:hypothetical protein
MAGTARGGPRGDLTSRGPGRTIPRVRGRLAIPALALTAVAFLLVPAAASARTRAIDSYCSPTGDFCTYVARSGGRVKLVLRTFSFRGRYRLCVKPPRHSRQCRSYRLVARRHGIYASRIDFARHFFHRASGRYTVSWHLSGSRIGPPLHFRKR